MNIFMTPLLALTLAAAAAPDTSSPHAVLASLQRADNANDLETVVALYADDATLLPPEEARVDGKAAIRSRYTALFARTRMDARFEIDDEKAGDATGYIRGRMIGKRTAANGAVEDLTGKFVMLFRKERGGWRIASLIWNADR